MARIAGVNLPNNKRAEIALTYIYGLGLSTSQKILQSLKIDANTQVKDLTEEEVNRLRQKIEKDYHVEGELRRERMTNIKRLREIKCYRGLRHVKGLPVNGQRTKTNSRTVRGNRRVTMGSGRAPAAQKT